MTKQRSVHWAEWAFIALCVLALIGIVTVMTTSEPKERIRRDCVRAGYADYERIGRTLVCVGIRDGAYVVESLDDVRVRQGKVN